MVSFSTPFILSMCNVGIRCSFSTALLFLIMTYDETAFRQDEKRRRKSERLVKRRQRKEENKAQEQKRIRELNKLRLDVKISVDNDDGDDLGGFYLHT